MNSVYEYSGYLKTILPAPDVSERDQLDAIVFTVDDLARWQTRDLESDKEWVPIAVNRTRTADGIRLTGNFEPVREIDNLSADDPSFWVPLSSLEWNDPRFPIDLNRFPVVEITYRCATEHARPAWVWTYPGGLHFDGLTPTGRWHTVVRKLQHGGFPSQADAVIFRLYSTSRTTEALEIASLRFRQISAVEKEACEKDQARLEQHGPPRRYTVLDEFLPLGVYMDADTARRLAEMLGVSPEEYWALTFEDLVRHHHNTVALERVERLDPSEFTGLLSQAERFGVRILPVFKTPIGDTPEAHAEFVETNIKPYVRSDAILAWLAYDEPPEGQFQNLLDVKARIETIDAKHPAVFVTRHPSAFPLYAPHFAASGIDYYTSHAPWDIGELVRTHVPLTRGQQFWMVAPSFVYATGTPEWSICSELRLMVNLAFANGAKGWFAFTYHNDPIWISGSYQRSLTGPFLTFSDQWSDLGHRMESLFALAPLLLPAVPDHLPRQWYVSSIDTGEAKTVPEGVPPTSSFRLRGPDYDLYYVISNDVRGMASLNINIPPEAMSGVEIYDVTDFVQARTWAPMNFERHLEMFPGQARVMLVAPPKVCEHWRNLIAQRLIEEDRHQLAFDLHLVSVYGLDAREVQHLIDSIGSGDHLRDLQTMDRARDMLVDFIYDSPSICEARSGIIAASAAVCACDGALCRLLNRGKPEQAREFGLRVVPLAREFTHLRLELRQGKGEAILPHCKDVENRALGLLSEIRAATT
ncbi:MAG: hypothetical protein HY706_06015 [Candidatus Hydrogenedentes bacterium]|nr:hypothetical protein [Candidatus Hydrogenedentota bacterium]